MGYNRQRKRSGYPVHGAIDSHSVGQKWMVAEHSDAGSVVGRSRSCSGQGDPRTHTRPGLHTHTLTAPSLSPLLHSLLVFFSPVMLPPPFSILFLFLPSVRNPSATLHELHLPGEGAETSVRQNTDTQSSSSVSGQHQRHQDRRHMPP